MKRVKAIDIANELGISKASVSLALNGKPGVSEQKRQEILACKARLEQEAGAPPVSRSAAAPTAAPLSPDTGRLIKVVFVGRKECADWEQGMNFPGEVMSVFDARAKAAGASLGISYADLTPASVHQVITDCSQDSVAGVIIHGTELHPGDMRQFQGLQKPLVVYDSDTEEGLYHCVVPDNARGIRRAMEHFSCHGLTDVVYLAHTADIYNFRERRRGFWEALDAAGLPRSPERMVPLGRSPKTIYDEMKRYLNAHPLPQAFLMENFQISMGAIQALLDAGVHIPEDVSLIGVDEIPAFYLGGISLTTVQIPHRERAEAAMVLLMQEMQSPSQIKMRVMADCPLLEGKSVAKK